MKNEIEHLKKALADRTNRPEALTFDNFEEIHAAGQQENITSLNFPDISPELLEEQYRIQTTTQAEHPSPITGNKPLVADVVKLPQTVSAIETDEKIITDILKNSPLAEAGLVSKSDGSETNWTKPSLNKGFEKKSFWNRIFGN